MDKRIVMLNVWEQDGWTLTQPYGMTPYAKELESDYIKGKYKNRVYPHIQHIGNDWAGRPKGYQVRAMHAGQVQWADYNNLKKARGIYVSIWDLNQEIATLTLHLDSVAVRRKQFVKAGDIIGYVGKTGWCEGVHVHSGSYYTKDGYILKNVNDLGGSFDYMDTKLVRLVS